MSNIPDWQKTIREAQREAQRRADEASAEEARKAAEKDAKDGADLAKVLSKLLGFEIVPLPTNEWVSPDGIHFAFRYKTDGWQRGCADFSEGVTSSDTNRLHWWFHLGIWKPAPPEYAEDWSDFDSISADLDVKGRPINSDWSDVCSWIADQIDRIEQNWKDGVKRRSERARNQAVTQSSARPATSAEQLTFSIEQLIREIVRSEYLY